MQQLKLFSEQNNIQKQVKFESISAAFTMIADKTYEVMLEINSNKFLIHFTTTMNKIEKFEIVAVKWFIDMSVSIMKTIKKIIYKLYFEY